MCTSALQRVNHSWHFLAVSKLHSQFCLGLGNKTTWLGLAKDHGLGSNQFLTFGFTQDMNISLLGGSPVFDRPTQPPLCVNVSGL